MILIIKRERIYMFYLVNLTLINYNNEKLGFELNLNINLFIKDQRDNY